MTHRKISIYSGEYIPCTCQECVTKRTPVSICPVCATRQLGDDLCPEHPKTSAYSDQMKQKVIADKLGTTIICPSCAQPQGPCKNCTQKDKQMNQTDEICAWVTNHPTGAPYTTVYVLGCICDKCEQIITVSLCMTCARNWTSTAPNARCGNCNGTLSWQLHDIKSGETLTHINTSELL